MIRSGTPLAAGEAADYVIFKEINDFWEGDIIIVRKAYFAFKKKRRIKTIQQNQRTGVLLKLEKPLQKEAIISMKAMGKTLPEKSYREASFSINRFKR